MLHEYITTDEPINSGKIEGDYYIISGRSGSRNKIPPQEKYLNDAKILEKGYYESKKNDDDLFHRYAYYCANSYYDAGDKKLAKTWYLETLKCNGWFDERYNSCLKLYELIENESRFYYLLTSYTYNPERVEGIFLLIKHYTIEQQYNIAWAYYTLIQDYYEKRYLSDDLSKKLFADVMIYKYYLPYYMIIVSERVKKYDTGIKMYNILFEKMSTPGQWWTDNLMYNLKFFNYKNYNLKNRYISFLRSENQIINNETDVLFYVGFSKDYWNITYSKSNALGGSERAVINLAKQFPKNQKIIILGDVLEETIDNITFIHRSNLDLSLIHIKTIIVSRYVSFFTLYPKYNCDKLILMSHDTQFLNNITGCDKSPGQIISENKISQTVCLTEWHKNHISNLYPELKDAITVINNGIDVSLFKTQTKVKNSFIYTSCPERGLDRLLELWPEIIQVLPDATLNIASYQDVEIKELKNVTYHGKLNQKDLYSLMAKSEYWLYPCCFEETSCITAMEMLMSGVICLYYPIAALNETVGKYGIKVSKGNEINTILNLKEKEKLIKEGKEYALRCCWSNRYIEWFKLIYEPVFYCQEYFTKEMIQEYTNSLDIPLTTKIQENRHTIFVYELKEPKNNFSYLNTEPLNLKSRLDYVIDISNKYPDIVLYDYSQSNVNILKEYGIKSVYLPYIYNETEISFLKEQKLQNEQIYDYGIICSSGYVSTEVLTPPRRKKIVDHLLSQGTVNIISGFGKERDIELSKCKTILNIHGEYMGEISSIFEHIRCDRLLYAGYNILSEESYKLDETFHNKYKDKLKFINYESFFKMKTKLVDTFIFYNELDMLEYRLNTLCDTVDYFVLVESTLTFTGKPKKLYFNENKERFKQFKIVHIIVDDLDPTPGQEWKNEKYQRNCIKRGISNLNPDDIVILSDVDEIPDPETIRNFDYEICSLQQEFYYYNLNCKMDHYWYRSKIFKYKNSKDDLDELRTSYKPVLEKGGWHLSYFGNSDFISNKIKNFSHQEYNNEKYTNVDSISELVKNKKDLFGRNIVIQNIQFSDNTYLPPNYQMLIKKKNYCFIHSCSINGTELLQVLLKRVKESGIDFEKIQIINIGPPIDLENVINFSDDPLLFEIPTINFIREFVTNQNANILYLHTKGITYNDIKIKDWVDMMLYFLLKPDCIKLLDEYDTLGCDLKNLPNDINPKHYSGNFWWSTSEYISTLPFCEQDKMEAEFWLLKNNPNSLSLHNSNVDHYLERYPPSKYDFISEITSAWTGHRDFAEWLIGYMNPETIVELGVDYGFSTFVFANASPGKVYGIDLFEGDGHAGHRNTYNFVMEKAESFKNLEIIKGDFSDVSKTWNKPIDILHIDGYHTYEAVKNDFDCWSKYVKEDGVILFHDTHIEYFGIKDFFKELPEYTLYFTHSAGLGIYTKSKERFNHLKNYPGILF